MTREREMKSKYIEGLCGEVDYYTQMLFGEGCLNKYLYSRRRSETDKCDCHGEVVDGVITCLHGVKYNGSRPNYNSILWKVFSEVNMMKNLDAIGRTLDMGPGSLKRHNRK